MTTLSYYFNCVRDMLCNDVFTSDEHKNNEANENKQTNKQSKDKQTFFVLNFQNDNIRSPSSSSAASVAIKSLYNKYPD